MKSAYILQSGTLLTVKKFSYAELIVVKIQFMSRQLNLPTLLINVGKYAPRI